MLYAYNEAGETIDMPMDPPPVMFFKSHREVEAAIQRGEVRRPETAINDQVIWRWPEKRGAQIMEHATNVDADKTILNASAGASIRQLYR